MSKLTPTKIAKLIAAAESKEAAQEILDAADAAYEKAKEKCRKKAIKAEDAPNKAAKVAKRARKAEKDAERALWCRNNGSGIMGEPYAWRMHADALAEKVKRLEENVEAFELAAEAAERKMERADEVWGAANAAFETRFGAKSEG